MMVRVSFGMWLKQRRIGLGMTQGALAACASCSVALIRKIESDERRPSPQVAELLAGCLQVGPEERETFMAAARGATLPDGLPPVGEQGRWQLPAAATPLVGRDVELREVGAMLCEPDCRLVTLVGPGGVGKTRLALGVAALQTAAQQTAAQQAAAQQAAADNRDRYAHGAAFVSLAAVADKNLVASALAEGLGVALAGGSDALTQLVEALREKRLLLVVDNLEHLLDGVADLGTLLQKAPGVTVLATSRERLNLQGEWVFEVRGLLTPSDLAAEEVGVAEAASYEAVQLFVHSARRSAANFRLDAQNVGPVVRICRLMEGFPLGIELAAAWVHVLDCAGIAEELARSFDFGAEGGARLRGFPERQRSLRAAFDYSWQLMGEAEQEALQRLSLFEGGFTREAAKAAGVGLALLGSLVDKSLVRRTADGRYGQHAVVRQFAVERLLARADDRAEEAMAGHVAYYLAYVRERTARLTSAEQAAALAELDVEIANIRLAWRSAVEFQWWDQMEGVAWPLYYYLELRNHFEAGETLFRSPSKQSDPYLTTSAGLVAEVQALLRSGELKVHEAFFAFRRGRLVEARALYEEGLQMLELYGFPLSTLTDSSETRFARAHGWFHLAYMCWIGGDLGGAEEALAQGVPLLEGMENGWMVANAYAAQGAVAHERGAFEQAYSLLWDGVQKAQEMGDPHLISFCSHLLARTALALGKGEALEWMAQIGAAAGETGDRWSEGLRLEQQGAAARVQGELEKAQQYYEGAVAQYEAIDDRWSLARALNLLGNVALARNEAALARESFVAAGRAAQAVQAVLLLLEALVGLVQVAEQEKGEGAAQAIAWHVSRHPAATPEMKARVGPGVDGGRTFEDVVREALGGQRTADDRRR